MAVHYGIDIASFQHPNGDPIDWKAAYTYLYDKGGCQPFVIIKITQSDGYANPYALQDIRDAIVAGFAVAIYHFMAGNVPASAQLNWIESHLDGVEFVFLDCETENGSTAPAYVDLISQVVSGLKAIGERSGVYTYVNFLGWLTSGGYTNTDPLWLADPSKVDPGQTRVITQYGQGNIPGITGAVDVDMADAVGFQDVFGKSPVNPNPVTPTPEPTPAPTPTPAPSVKPTLHFVEVALDGNGNGAALMDGGASPEAGVTSVFPVVEFAYFIAATAQGSNPPKDHAYWSWTPHVQNYNGYVLLTVTGGQPNGNAGVYVAATA